METRQLGQVCSQVYREYDQSVVLTVRHRQGVMFCYRRVKSRV